MRAAALARSVGLLIARAYTRVAPLACVEVEEMAVRALTL